MSPQDIVFASAGYLLVRRRGHHLVYYVVEFKTI